MASKIVTLLLSIFYGCWMLLISVIRMIKIGRKQFFYIKKRETPPACLSDPTLGQHGHLTLKNAKIHYVMNGDSNNPLMLLLHGFPDFWFTWKHQLREFSKEYCVVAIDLRGYGDSEKKRKLEDYKIPSLVEDLREVIKYFAKNSSGKAIVISHDWGGFLSYFLAAKYPEIVSRLIVANAPHPRAFAKTIRTSWKQFLMSWYTFYFQLPNLPEITFLSEDLAVFDRIFRNGKKNTLSKDELEAYKYIYSRPGALTHAINYYRANLGASAKIDKNEPYRISCPMMLLWGDKDIALSLLSATESAMYIDNFNLKVLKGASHWCQLDAPEEFNTHVWNFVKKEN